MPLEHGKEFIQPFAQVPHGPGLEVGGWVVRRVAGQMGHVLTWATWVVGQTHDPPRPTLCPVGKMGVKNVLISYAFCVDHKKSEKYIHFTSRHILSVIPCSAVPAV